MVRIVKLITGEIIIAKIDELQNNVAVTKPLAFVETEQGPGLTPYDPFIKDETILIGYEHILYMAEPHEQLVAAYKSETGGILLPNKGIING